tara:strand:+ start:13674 stop:14843 length:1170 start_codon:yes stop_codon:yes gene_type:complete
MRYFPFIIISLVLYSLFFYHSQQPELLSVVDNNAHQEKIIKSKVIDFDFEKAIELTPTLSNTSVDELSIDNSTTQKALQEAQTESIEAAESVALLLENEVVESNSEVIPKPILDIEVPTSDISKTISEKATPAIEIAKNIPPISTKIVPEYEMPVAIAETPITTNEESTTTPDVTIEVIEVVEAVEVEKEEKNLSPGSLHSMQAREAALLKGEFYDNNFHLYLSPAPVKNNKMQTKTASNKSDANTTSITQASASESLQKLIQHKPKLEKTNQVSQKNNDKPKPSFKKVLKPVINKSANGIPEAIVASGNKPSYPTQALNDKLQGTVTVKFIVSMQGNSKNPQMLSSSGHKILDKTVLDFVKKERFMPSFDGTEKITSEQQFSFKFTQE